jgi:hypothetical protein
LARAARLGGRLPDAVAAGTTSATARYWAGARRKAGVAYSAVAAVFVRKAALELPHPLETIAALQAHAGAEMRVLMMIVQLAVCTKLRRCSAFPRRL